MKGVTPERIGYGLYARATCTPGPTSCVPCCCRTQPRQAAAPLDWERDTVTVIETNLDDINAEHLGHFVETALGAGALDVRADPDEKRSPRRVADRVV